MNLDWLAGFFDGEGGIFVGDHPRALPIFVSLTNRDQSSILLVLREFPLGTLITTESKGNSSTTYQIRWQGRKASPFLEAIKDKVVIKKSQVELALRFISLISDWGKGGGFYEGLDERLRIAEEIDRLNNYDRPPKISFTRRSDRIFTRALDNLGVTKEQLSEALSKIENAKPKS